MTFPDEIKRKCCECKGTGRSAWHDHKKKCEDCDGTGWVTVCGHCDAYLEDCKCTCTSCGEEHESCECETGGEA